MLALQQYSNVPGQAPSFSPSSPIIPTNRRRRRALAQVRDDVLDRLERIR